jgi:UDP-N-acetylmuramate--alanine ligase
MRLKDANKVYFLGIGGIGMSAIARLFLQQGKEVHGYDRTSTHLTQALEAEGMHIHYHDEPEQIPSELDMVVVTPAVPKDLAEYVYLASLGIPMLKRSEVLGLLSRDLFTVAISGTHGKTSITAMLSHILYVAGFGFTGFVGGLLRNYNSNLIRFGDGSRIVVEADEYDRSFHTLRPDLAMISAIDADHLDIYGTYEQLKADYQIFARGLKPGGSLLLHEDLEWDDDDLNCLYYGFKGEFRMLKCEASGHRSQLIFDLNGKRSREFSLQIPGRHNAENALAAAALAHLIGVGIEDICDALSGFTGVVRRFDIRVSSQSLVYVDDYAHHPKELEAAIKAAREYFPGMKLTGVFQPHLYTRTRDLAQGFAASLDLLDQAILMDIYPARELPIEGVSSAMISALMHNPCPVLSSDEVLDLARGMGDGIFLSLGAGDIDLLVEPLERIFASKAGKEPVV